MGILWKLSEAAAWLEHGCCVCDQCPGEDEHVQDEVHALLFCQNHRVCELSKHFSFLFTPIFEGYSAAQPFLLQQVNNQLVHDFLSQQNNRLFSFSFWASYGFICGWPRPVSSRSAKQPGWRSPPIVTITITIITIVETTSATFQSQKDTVKYVAGCRTPQIQNTNTTLLKQFLLK